MLVRIIYIRTSIFPICNTCTEESPRKSCRVYLHGLMFVMLIIMIIIQNNYPFILNEISCSCQIIKYLFEQLIAELLCMFQDPLHHS